MKRTVLSWAIFAAALALVLGVMSFFTLRMLQFERAVTVADARAAVEENARLALWRMDSAAAVMLAPQPNSQAQAQRRELQNVRSENVMQGNFRSRNDPAVQVQLSQQEFQQREAITPSAPTDWHTIEPALLERIGDLIPGARLESVDETAPRADDTRRLASIPARLVVPAAAFDPRALPWNTPLRISLMTAWVCAIVASLAVAILLRGALALSERRGAFVSAVTHELRTPLTTFRMYSEMLAGGMVGDPAARQQYLDTMVSECDRLNYLIENVLAYARLERQLSPARAQPRRIGDLLDSALPALRRRADQAGLALDVQIPADVSARLCATDSIALQQILLNLVDNACKYGRTGIELSVSAPQNEVEFRVTDHGSGLAPEAAARLFKAFSKSKSDAVPGIGLGLFLSRRLARELKGDLQHIASGAGTTFVLNLPIET